MVGNMKVESRGWRLKRRFKSMPKLTDFELTCEQLMGLQEGEILVKAEWLSVDPYMRAWSRSFDIGQVMPGGQIARVIDSQNPAFPIGSQVVGPFGWRDVTVYKPKKSHQQNAQTMVYPLPDMCGLPDSYALGAMGMPGNAAYIGVTKVLKPKAGDILVVSGAAGAVGSIVGQIGKIMGCTVIGLAGTDEKVDWLKNELKFDNAINYKTQDVDRILKNFAPDGINCYFDNVGGDVSHHVISNMCYGGRILSCGSISSYNKDGSMDKTEDYFDDNLIQKKNIKVHDFAVFSWKTSWFESINQMREWVLEGKVQVRERVTDGFQWMPQAFIDLLQGKNIGKQVVRV